MFSSILFLDFFLVKDTRVNILLTTALLTEVIKQIKA